MSAIGHPGPRPRARNLARSAIVCAAGWFSLDKETREPLAPLPTNRDVLF